MAITCPKCKHQYDVTLFEFGNVVKCDCGARIKLVPGKGVILQSKNTEKTMLKHKIPILVFVLLFLLLPAITFASTDVYFSLIDDPEGAIIKQLNQVQESIDIAMYYFTDRDLANAVINAHERGIKVRVYLDKEQKEAKYSKSRYLAKHDITIRYSDNPYIMHNKFCVIDNEVVITGSYNWTASAGERNNENLLIIKDPCIAYRYEKEFNRLYNEHYLSEEMEAPEKGEIAEAFKVAAVCFRGHPDGKDEWIVIQNISDRTYNLKGWHIADDGGHEFEIIENLELAPKQTLAIVNRKTSEVTVLYDKIYCLSYDNYWWNNDGDVVRLLDSKKLLIMEMKVENSSSLRVCK